ncbi:MAG: CpsB/CapC family capsule biosynthesis tyrosine phosphatase [Algibacter sp.]
MLNFFSKKQYLRDLLENFVDMHCHILPGIDDGAKNVEDSINIIKGLQDLGIREFIATPHIMQDLYLNDDESIGDSFQVLLEAINYGPLKKIPINPSAEYMMDDNFSMLLDQNNIFPLKEKYVLVEMSYFQPPINLEEIIFKIKMKDFTPIIAHPERYSFYHNKKEYYKELKRLGCFFQLNLLSLSEYYGKGTQKIGAFLLEENLIDFVGTDTHHMNHIKSLSKIIINNKHKKNVLKVIENTTKTFSVL